ncbi:MAG: glucoamylase family protein, partial [Christensenellales bacterium]
MHGNKYSHIPDDLTLSRQELLKLACDLSLNDKVYSKKVDVNIFKLGEQRRKIENAYKAARLRKYKSGEIPSLAEWFYDNRALFIEQIKQLELSRCPRRLPHYKNGRYAHWPRSLALASVLLGHSSLDISAGSMREFLETYQKEAELDSGELWIFTDMLKVALLRAVGELAYKSILTIGMWNRAELFCAKIEKDMTAAAAILDEHKAVLSNPYFIEHSMVLLRESPHITSVRDALDKRLSLRGQSVQRQIKKAHAMQTSAIARISGAMSSLRMLAKLYFEPVFESLSAVHRYLGEDEYYLAMDFDSREYYRRAVADIAQIMKMPEPSVAREAVKTAAGAGAHVGDYLIGGGVKELYRHIGGIPPKIRAKLFFKRHMLLFYAGGAAVSAFVSAALLCISLFYMFPPSVGILGFIVSLVPVYTVAIAINNRIFTLIGKPAFIPKIEFKQGIPERCATVVVVPALVTDAKSGLELLGKMEVYWAANQQENIYFALLSDFKEDKNEIAAGDENTIEEIEGLTLRLNERYGKALFFYAQRKRTLNTKTGRYGGYERKRGALLDFCELLRGDASAFVHVTKGLPASVKYVITLDSDTELARDAAVKMVGAMEHPLCRPVIDESRGVVAQGYGIMQPRIGVDVISAAQTRFSLVYAGKGGLDTYASAVSDIYQDGFGTAIFAGKGIFNLHVYLRVLKNAFPDDCILSHDLLEGSYLRCALLSDVVLMDGCPSRYTAWARRQHRWIRGDWQLLPRLAPTVRTKNKRRSNPLSALAKYQILDNIRRSLSVPLSFVVILLSQTAFYRSAFFWLISGLMPLFIDSILDFAVRMSVLMRNTGKGTTVKDIWHETKTMFEQAFYKFAFLPYETYMTIDAAVRSVVRMSVTRRNLLEWETAAEGEKKIKSGVIYYWRHMVAAPLLAAALYGLSIAFTHSFSAVTFLVFGVWFFAPSIAHAISRRKKTKMQKPDAQQTEYLEDTALKTWRFFNDFSNEDEHFWMPDNFQQSPGRGVAKRTSPTNVAFSMAAVICAYYMGFVFLPEALKRLEACVGGIWKAEKWHGHLYNWYDITNLTPLEPRYISSVDSGNLACYLITADAALSDMLKQPLAAFLEQGLKTVYRECGRKCGYAIGSDIFKATGTLETLLDENASLRDFCLKTRSYTDRYAPWAKVLRDFPADKLNIYNEHIKELRERLREISPLGYIEVFHSLLELLSGVVQTAKRERDDDVLAFVNRMETALGEGYIAVRRFCMRKDRLCRRMAAIVAQMDFTKLYDEEKALFSIGFDYGNGVLNDSHYDLLATEARAASFIAIAKGDVPEKHWFRLSRPLTIAGDGRVLLSWGGTMFEYLMPLILQKSYDNTLLSETYKSVVDMQISYGELRRLPWGVSESGYYAFDLDLNYQYKAFGVPGLGLKSGLVREMVVTPYAACLALHINPRAAITNLQRLQKLGASGRYGFFEAIDYTPARLNKGRNKHIIKSYMAHHQGMILSSILNCVRDGKMQELFHSATSVKATEMLLKEKVPPRSVTLNLDEKPVETGRFAEEIRALRVFRTLSQYPEAHFLSNGSYTVMITQLGTGFSICRERLISRWENDVLRSAPGIHIYIKNLDTGAVWSAAFLPTCLGADEERVQFEPHMASFMRRVHGIETTMEVFVSPECDMEIRSLNIKNGSDDMARLALYCVFSPALSTERDFLAHPAFEELFIETIEDPENRTVFANRRGKRVWAALKACFETKTDLLTDRTQIFGRQTVLGIPKLMGEQHAERDIMHAVGIRAEIEIDAGKTGRASFAVTMADSREGAAKCLASVTGEEDIRRVLHLAWTHAQVEMRYLKLDSRQATTFWRIASRTVIKIPSVCAVTEKPRGKETLFKYGLSGETPIICLFVSEQEHAQCLNTLAKALEFLSLRRIAADLVIIYKDSGAYIDPLRDKITELSGAAFGRIYGRIIVVPRDNASDAATLAAAASLVLEAGESLDEQLKNPSVTWPYHVFESEPAERRGRVPRRIKTYDNGTGGFISGGAEYHIEAAENGVLPWCNLLAGKSLGTLISAGGGGYTWVGNARMTRLTPFRNDALTDVPGEGVIVRNERTGFAFSTAPDLYMNGRYHVTHGFGYTVFERFGGVTTKATWFADVDIPVKAGLLTISNHTGRDETFSVYYYAEPVLGASVSSGIRAEKKGDRIEACSPFAPQSGAMFISMPGRDVLCTASALEFFGVPGHNIFPEALKRERLSDSDGCGATLLALSSRITLKNGETKTMPLLMGYGDEKQISETTQKMDSAESVGRRLLKTMEHWKRLTGKIRVLTTVKTLDTLVNGWLVYQTYSSRLLGRTGYYQSGGAFGFRDQLQDVMSLLYIDPHAARTHIIKCAARQFIEGDVLHWWHEPASGVRTYITDDKLFLPYAACEYERVTGDMSVFDERAPYIESRSIPEGEYDLYDSFNISETSENVFGHCVRAINSALRFGEHGLPLMGTGDWNDGMDKVGAGGKGESVWLAFFLITVLKMFVDICARRGETGLAAKYVKTIEMLRHNTESCAWDGEWYLRAFFDDGTKLGSRESKECSIDLLSQAWSVLSGAARARRAFMSAADKLVMREEGVIRLLTPPFDKWEKDPGYIKSYLPGVRENGGQYTHA